MFIPDPDPDFYLSRIPDQGSKTGTGSWIRIRNTDHEMDILLRTIKLDQYFSVLPMVLIIFEELTPVTLTCELYT
jgi:hypothetical protein